MSHIIIDQLSFAHEGASDHIFEKLCLTLDSDWRLGFIGRNGRGKTTLLKLLAGAYEYSGLISSLLSFDYFPYQIPEEIPAGEGLRAVLPDFEDWRMARELSLLSVDPEVLDRPFRTLSGGERTKVLLAALFQKEGGFPLIDEPTNHLDRAGRELLGEYLKRKPGFILVSHDRAFLDQAIDHVLALGKTGFELQKGNFSSWRQNRDYQDQYELEREEKLKGDVKRLEEAARRGADWSRRLEKTKYGHGVPDRGFVGSQAARLMKRAKTVDRRRGQALEEARGLWQNRETDEKLLINSLKHPQKRLMSISDLSLGYEGRPAIIRGLNLNLDQGERLMVTGPNGCGKSSLLKAVIGELRPQAGQLHRAANLELSYVPQVLNFAPGTGLKSFCRDRRLDESLFKAILHKLGFEKKHFEGDLGDFSQGQQKKVLIAACLCRPAHLQVWDEPLNHIDLISRMQIESLILEHQPTLLMVEHDRRFAEAVATGLVEL